MHFTEDPDFVEAIQNPTAPRVTRIEFSSFQTCLSWAPWNGGSVSDIRTVLNFTCLPGEVEAEHFDAAAWLRSRVRMMGLEARQTVALLTAVPQSALRYGSHCDPETGLTAKAYCTLGLGNASAPGDPATYNEELEIARYRPGTINLTVAVNRALTQSAQIELLSSVTQAKSSVMAAFGRRSSVSGNVCLGTGTDCTAVLSPMLHRVTLRFAGAHCRVAEVAARAAIEAMRSALHAHLAHAAAQGS